MASSVFPHQVLKSNDPVAIFWTLRLKLASSCVVLLFFFGHDLQGGLLLKRFDRHAYRTPHACLTEIPYCEEDLPLLVNFEANDTAFLKLTKYFFSWIAEYESWIEEEFGSSYIQQCLDSRDKQAIVGGDQSAAAWSELAQKYR